ncbi:hypothetical protein [Noviherbaspirillum malthae]|uniref:hypothetical protein n=1 Tax=Noviherbaspirillum malthae TaxID=1260987 RepID=UPI00188E3AA5|nr:hypothetical protein [Noviherbaspirillum malthae]
MKPTKLGFERVDNGVDKNAPLLYQILVTFRETGEVKTIYVGKSENGAGRPYQRYDANIRRKIAGLPPLNGSRYRPVHHDLHAAYSAGHRVSIELVRNVDLSNESILAAEASLQRQHNLKPLAGQEARQLNDMGHPLNK